MRVLKAPLGVGVKRKGPRTKAPFTSHHPLPPKRSFKEKLIEHHADGSLLRNPYLSFTTCNITSGLSIASAGVATIGLSTVSV